MTPTISSIGTTASEQMYFGGAPFAHIELYYEQLRRRRLARALHDASRQRHRQISATMNLADTSTALTLVHPRFAQPSV